MSDTDPTRPEEPTISDQPAIEEERGRSNQGLIVVAIVAVIALIAAAAWWFSRDPEPVEPTATATVTTTTETTATSTETASAPVEPSEPQTTTQPTTAPASPEPTDAQPSVTGEQPGTDPVADYRTTGGSGQGVYFSAVGGNFLCVISESGTVGCQSRVVLPEMECGDDPQGRAAMVSWQRGDAQAETGCTAEGIFVATPTTGSGPGNVELPAGESLVVDQVVCEASGTQVSCYPEGTNGGFVISEQGIQLPV